MFLYALVFLFVFSMYSSRLYVESTTQSSILLSLHSLFFLLIKSLSVISQIWNLVWDHKFSWHLFNLSDLFPFPFYLTRETAQVFILLMRFWLQSLGSISLFLNFISICLSTSTVIKYLLYSFSSGVQMLSWIVVLFFWLLLSSHFFLINRTHFALLNLIPISLLYISNTYIWVIGFLSF